MFINSVCVNQATFPFEKDGPLWILLSSSEKKYVICNVSMPAQLETCKQKASAIILKYHRQVSLAHMTSRYGVTHFEFSTNGKHVFM